MTRGPARKPIERERLEGYPGKRAGRGKQEVEALPVSPDIGPPFEDMTDMAKEKWKVLQHEWQLILKISDRDLLREYCEIWADLRVANTLLTATGGPVVIGINGGLVMNPWSRHIKDYRDKLISMMMQFGATPSTRGKVLLDMQSRGEGKSKFEGLIN